MNPSSFDDLNPQSEHLWKYPDTGHWDAARNTREFVSAMDDYAAKGLHAVTVSLQGGSPCGNNPHDNKYPCGQSYNRDSSAFSADGRLRRAAFGRMGSIIEKADELGMAVIMQLFYPGFAMRIFESNDANVKAAADNAVDWILDHNYTNVVLDVCNECNLCGFMQNRWKDNGACPAMRMKLSSLHWANADSTIHAPDDHGGLLDRIRRRANARGRPLFLSSSYVGGYLPCTKGSGAHMPSSCSELSHFDFVNVGNELSISAPLDHVVPCCACC